jgi:Zn-dependent peptidase ImmA (M78 family)
MKLERIELADIASPSRLAEAIVKQIPGLTYPVPVEQIARALDITDVQEIKSEGFAGALITDDAKSEGIILVQRGLPERQRYSIGHELGHFLCPHHVPPAGGFKCTTRDMFNQESLAQGRESWEVEANRFSAELLMPFDLFKKALRSRKVFDLDHIIDIARRFEVSTIAGTRRAVDIGDSACAVVVSKDGVLASTPCRSKDFPYIALKRGMQLPRQSMSYAYAGEEGRVSSLDESETSLWTNNAPRGVTIYEQVAVQAAGYKLTLLISETAEDEDEDDRDEEAERRQQVRW